MGHRWGTLGFLLIFPVSALAGALGPRSGYEGNKAWDQAIRKAIDQEDTAALGSMFAAKVGSGAPLVIKRADLFSVYKAKPKFFVRAGYAYYGQDFGCLLQWLVPPSESVPFHEVMAAIEKNQDTLVEAFRTEAQARHARHAGGQLSDGKFSLCLKPGSKPREVDTN